MKKLAETKYAVNELIKKRWSPRSFTDQKVDKETLFSLFEAASWAASSRNEQPWRFIYGIKDEGVNYVKIFETLTNWNQQWANSARVLVLTVAKLNSSHNNKPNPKAIYDLGQAVATMAVQAISQNLYIHQMGGFDADRAKKSFNLPVDYEPVTAIAIGYLGNSSALSGEYRESEEKARTRNPVESFIFDGDFKI